ncbi:hypothetical protein ACOME3_007814 [Neoechinorhynchus agilis]
MFIDCFANSGEGAFSESKELKYCLPVFGPPEGRFHLIKHELEPLRTLDDVTKFINGLTNDQAISNDQKEDKFDIYSLDYEIIGTSMSESRTADIIRLFYQAYLRTSDMYHRMSELQRNLNGKYGKHWSVFFGPPFGCAIATKGNAFLCVRFSEITFLVYKIYQSAMYRKRTLRMDTDSLARLTFTKDITLNEVITMRINEENRKMKGFDEEPEEDDRSKSPSVDEILSTNVEDHISDIRPSLDVTNDEER